MIVADDWLTDGISAEGLTKLYHYPGKYSF